MTDLFIRRGYWELNPADGNATSRAKLDCIQPGDAIAIKGAFGAPNPDIQIKAIGIVKEVGEDRRVYVDWKKTFGERERLVPSMGAFGAIRGYNLDSDHSDWLNKIFRLV